MKKVIVILILVVYVASIAVVNFFGLEVKEFDGITYVESIQCDTVTLHNENSMELPPTTYHGSIPVFVFNFIPPATGEYTTDIDSLDSNPNAVELNYVVFPHLADESSVKFEYDAASMDGVAYFHELSKTLIFLQPNKLFTITIKATDGSNKSTQVKIMGSYAE